MTAGYLRGPGWVASATVGRATEFIDAHVGQPIPSGRWGWASLSGFTLAYRRCFGNLPGLAPRK
jgi:hypothetical protein